VRVTVAGQVGESKLTEQLPTGGRGRIADCGERGKRSGRTQQVLVGRRTVCCLTPVLHRKRLQLAVDRDAIEATHKQPRRPVAIGRELMRRDRQPR
jgi:hypothetical protein